MKGIPNLLSRRAFLRRTAGSAALALVPSWLQATVRNPFTVSIFHTTDLHGHILPTSSYDGTADLGGLARCATQIQQWKEFNPHHVLVDLGDLYQGTYVGLHTRGRVMTRALNFLDYDAWVLGNHEFDWGIDTVRTAIGDSRMPVITSNARWDGVPTERLPRHHHPYANVHPYLLKQLGDFRIGVIGATTPGMPNWFPPELLADFEVLDPIEPVRRALSELRQQNADAVILACHMGIYPWGARDNHANRVDALTREFPEIVAVLGSHTHRDLPDRHVNGTVYTQANYHGIHVGKLDLVFDADSHRLAQIRPVTQLMDSRIVLHSGILSLAHHDLQAAGHEAGRPLGTLAHTLEVTHAPGTPSDLERLFGVAFMDRLAARGKPVDAFVHGNLFNSRPIPAGLKTLGDLFEILPFENYVVVGELTSDEIKVILREIYSGRNISNLIGMEVVVQGSGEGLSIRTIYDQEGQPLRPGHRYRIGFNSYDSASGGGRFPRLRSILEQPESRRALLPYQTRALLAEFFQEQESLSIPRGDRVRNPGAAIPSEAPSGRRASRPPGADSPPPVLSPPSVPAGLFASSPSRRL